jgi:hypothetical protein
MSLPLVKPWTPRRVERFKGAAAWRKTMPDRAPKEQASGETGSPKSRNFNS